MKRISLSVVFTLLVLSSVVAGPPPDPAADRIKRIEASLRYTNLFGVPQVVGISKQNIIDFLGVPTANAGCPPTGQARAYYDPNTDTFYVRDSNCNIIISGGGAGTSVRLDQVLNPNQSKLFLLGGTALAFSGGTFDLSGATWFQFPVSAGCTTTASGQICFDSTNSNVHLWSGADSFLLSLAASGSYSDGDLLGVSKVGSTFKLKDLGPVNASAGGNSFVQINISNLMNDDSICWNASTLIWDNCSAGVPINVQSGVSYLLAAADRGTYVDLTNSGAVAVTLPQASTSGSFDANYFTFIKNDNSSLATVTPTTSTFSYHTRTPSALKMVVGEGCSILSDPSGSGTYYPRCNPTQDPEGDPMLIPDGVDVSTSGWYSWQIANNASTGTTANKMACDDGTGKAIICSHTTSTTNDPLGVAVAGDGVAPGLTGNTGICSLGFCSVTFDNTATANHYAQLSTSVDGDLSDVGTSAPTNSQTFYFIVSGNGGAGTNAVIRQMAPRELTAAAVNGGGKTSVQVNGTATQATVNFNSTVPAAGANNQNLTIQSSVSGKVTSASVEVPIANTAQGGIISGGCAANKILEGGSPNACVDFPDVKIIPAANCPNAVAGSGWSYATSTYTAACRAGSNNLGGALQLAPSAGGAAQFRIEIPSDWDSASQPFIRIEYGSGANTTGTVIWTVASACTKADGSVTDDPAFNSESAFATQTMAVANRAWAQTGQFTAITSGNNCVGGGGMILRLTLSGTASSAINVYQAVVTTQRLPVVQAN